VVIDVYDKRVWKLNNTVQNLATTNIIFKAHIQGYQQALQNEKKKRKCSQPMFCCLAASEEGKAIFYSPAKVKAAHDL